MFSALISRPPPIEWAVLSVRKFTSCIAESLIESSTIPVVPDGGDISGFTYTNFTRGCDLSSLIWIDSPLKSATVPMDLKTITPLAGSNCIKESHLALHVPQSSLFQSSHTSPFVTRPSPQPGSVQLLLQPSSSMRFPSSQASPSSSFPLPHLSTGLQVPC